MMLTAAFRHLQSAQATKSNSLEEVIAAQCMGFLVTAYTSISGMDAAAAQVVLAALFRQ